MIKNSIIYLFSSVINKSVPFLLLPIMTAYLIPSEYGVLSIFLVAVSFYNAAVGMALQVNISKNFFIKSHEEMATIIGNIIIILICTTLISIIFTIIGWSINSNWFSIPFQVAIILPFLTIFATVNVLSKTLIRNQKKAWLFGLYEISHTLINSGVTILLLITIGLGWYSRVLGILSANIVFCSVGFYYLKKTKYLTFKYDKKVIKSILLISIPVIPHILGKVVLTLSDRIYIEQMINSEVLGIYSVGYSFGMIVLLFTNAFINTWSPWFYEKISTENENDKKKIVKYSYLYILGIFSISIFIAVISSWILPYVVNESYWGASQYILWICLGYAMFGTYQIFLPYLVHTSKTMFLAISTTVATIINLILNYFMINEYGAIGAAYSTFISYTVMVLLVAIYTQKKHPMPWKINLFNK